VFTGEGLYILGVDSTVNRITPGAYTSQTDEHLAGTILEGELIPKDSIRVPVDLPPPVEYQSDYIFLVYDLLRTGGSATLNDDTVVGSELPKGNPLKESYSVRMNQALRIKQIFDRVASDRSKAIISILVKPHRVFGTVGDFNRVMGEMLDAQETLGYETDGLVFTPMNVPYFRQTSGNPNLALGPSICKWKPVLTLDLAVRWEVDKSKKTAHVQAWDGRKLVDFTGTGRYPISSQAVVVDDAIRNIPSDTVVEFRWSEEIKKFVPEVIRYNKALPNSKEVVIDGWNLIHRPITEATLRGQSFDLLRQYHNRIKGSLYDSFPYQTLLDIGSGKGGDLGKIFRTIDKEGRAWLVEPNELNRTELLRRLGNYPKKLQKQITVLDQGGQDTDEIVDALKPTKKVDLISLMLSLSFFFQTPKLLQSLGDTLYQTLGKKGKIVFLTIDGRKVKQLFEAERSKESSDLLTGDTLTLGSIELTLVGDQLSVKFPGSIMGELQTEWLVDIDALLETHPEFNLDQIQDANQERFLSFNEQVYTSLFSYGVISFDKITSTKMRAASPDVEEPEVEEELELEVVPVARERSKKSGSIAIQKGDKLLSFIQDDEVDPINFAGLGKGKYDLVRIGAIGDGSCFFHAYLKSFYPRYQDESERTHRIDLTKKYRRDLAYSLEQVGADEQTNYRKFGYLDLFFDFRDSAGEFETEIKTDFTLRSLQRLFNSEEYADAAMFGYAVALTGITLVLTQGTEKELRFVELIQPREDMYPAKKHIAVVLINGGDHFEVVGVRNPEFGGKTYRAIQTIFPFQHPTSGTHPLIEALLKSK